MPWIPVTADDVLSEFNDSEKDAYDAATGADNLAVITARVVQELRGAIVGRAIPLGPDNTIPDSFTPPVIARARWNYLNSLPTGKSLLSDAREKANQEYVDLLKLIRTDKTFFIEPGDGSVPIVLPNVGEPKLKHFRRRREDGIV